jgi:hypothetical protein
MAEIARKAVRACGGTEPPSGVGGTILHEVEERLLATRIPAKLLKTSYLSIGCGEAVPPPTTFDRIPGAVQRKIG